MALRNFFPILALLGLLFLSACGSESDDTPQFDRKAMLEHYADQLIKPAFAQALQQAEALDNSIAQLVATPEEGQVAAARQAWGQAYLAFQSANAYNFGPAGEAGTRKTLVEEIGTFPAAVAKIEAFISANDHSLSTFDRDARGFLAIEYLLFGLEQSSADIAAALQASAARREHLSALSAHLLAQIAAANSAWQGSYRAEFVASTGTDVGSSTSQLYNQFVRSFESIKNFKVGLPAGKRPGQTQAEPQLVECYYSQRSLEMMKAHWAAILRIYEGGNGPGLKDYVAGSVGGSDLVALTEAQIAAVDAAFAQVPNDRPFQQLCAENNAQVDALHTELQKHTRFFKSDMSSLLGIAITFSSGDGD